MHWQRIRAQFLRLYPLCGSAPDPVLANADGASRCATEERTTAAQVVDHIIALRDNGTNQHANLRALCKRCHDARTMRDQVRGRGDQ